MAYVNIPRDRDDPNYRYKMPRLQSKVEGRGNGIRTNIYNMGDIARALKRPPMYPTKFFGCELGAMVKFEESEEKALINGAHNEEDLVNILDKFIQMYVLCAGCELPEIDILVKKGMLLCKCNACGYTGTLDNAHKAATYMVRNPPNSSESTLGKKKKTKEERRAEKSEKQERDKEKEKSKKMKEKKVKKKGDERDDEDSNKRADQSGDATPTNDGADSWDDDRSSDGERKEKDLKKKKKGKGERSSDRLMHKEALSFDSPEIKDVAERLRAVLVRDGGITVDDFFGEMRMLQVSQDFDAKCRVYVALMALFSDGMSPSILETKMPYLLKCCDASVDSNDVLTAVEYFCVESGATELSNYPYVLQKLYSGEILEGEDILSHYAKGKECEKFLICKKQAEPFLQWLAADDASDDD